MDKIIDRRYKVLQKLGSGGMGNVYQVRDLDNNTTLALKSSPDKHIEKEFLTLSKFQHPNIVKVYDLGIHNKKPYFTMKYIPGKNILEIFQKNFPDTKTGYRTLYTLLLQICQALRIIHFHKLIHGDIKPTNILIGDTAIITDFGLAQHPAKAKLKGTIQYIAPELLSGKPIDQRADLFSLGVALYQVLTKKMPFKGNSPIALLTAYEKGQVIPPKVLNPTVPQELNDLILKLLQPAPQARPKDINEVKGVIHRTSGKPEKPILVTPWFTNRQKELNILKKLLKEAKAGKGKVILIHGETGIGKTRLIQEFKSYAQIEDARVEEIKASESGIVNTLASALKIKQPIKGTEWGLFEKITEHFTRESKEKPIVIIFEDIESCNHLDIKFLKYLVGTSEDLPILLILTSKDGKWLESFKEKFEYINQIQLRSFTLRETANLIKSILLADNLSDAITKSVHKNTEGNPFLAEKLTQSLVENSIIRLTKEKWLLDSQKLKKLRLPKSIAGFVTNSLRMLNKEELVVLKVAALLGENFRLPILQDLIPVELSVLESLIKKRLIAKAFTGNYSFTHRTIAQSIEDKLNLKERRTLHKRVGEVLEKRFRQNLDDVASRLAHHYFQAGEKNKAYKFALRAGNRAKEIGIYNEAVKHFEQALSLAQESDKFTLYETIGERYQVMGQHPKSLSYYEKALFLASRTQPDCPALPAGRRQASSARIYRRIGEVYGNLKRYKEALEHFEKGLKLTARNIPEQILMLSNMGWVYMCLNKFEAALKFTARAIELTRSQKYEPYLGRPLSTMGAIYYRKKQWEESTKYYKQALEIGKKTGNQAVIETTYYNLGLITWQTGKFKDAQRFYEKGLEIAEKNVDVNGIGAYQKALGILTQEESNSEKAIEHYTAALSCFKKTGSKSHIADSYLSLATAYKDNKDWNKAIQSYEKAFSLARKLNDKFLIANVYSNLGDLYRAKNNIDKAIQNLQQALKAQQEIKDWQGAAFTCRTIGQLLISQNTKAALKYFNKALKISQDQKLKKEIPKIYLSLAELHLSRGKLDMAEDYCQKAVDLSQQAQDKFKLGISKRILGVVLCKMSELNNALATFSEAEEIFRALNTDYELGKTLLVTVDQTYAFRAKLGKKFWQEGLFEKNLARLNEATKIFEKLQATQDLHQVSKVRKKMEEYLPSLLEILPGEDKRLKTLYRMAQIINSIKSINKILPKILDLTIEIMEAERGLILFRENEELKVKVARNMDRQSILDMADFSKTIALDTAKTGDLIITSDARNDSRFRDRKSVAKFDLLSVLCVPLRIRGETIGAIYIDDRRKKTAFDKNDLKFLRAFADQAGIAVENARLISELKRAKKRLVKENVNLKEDLVYLRQAVTARFKFGNLIGKSEPMQQVYKALDKMIPYDSPVIIEGETGTGKELAANIIHYNGPRKDKRFVAVNCSALPENLLESELFGYVRGAFTGALRDKPGLFEVAHGGTIFFDEIAELSFNLQAKLLRVLQDGEIRRVGSTDYKKVDVRVIAATNKDLKKMLEKGKFRDDLFYRLNVMSLKMPPLKEKKADIPILANHILKKCKRHFRKNIKGFTPEVLSLIQSHNWPGNVRELENIIEYAVVTTESDKVTLKDLPQTLIKSIPDKEAIAINDVEKKHILKILKAANWKKAKAAKMLGITRPTLYRKIKEYNL